MDKKKKEIIINEIEYWEKNRFLPAHYCQYLLTMYTEGQGVDQFKKKINPPKTLILAIVFFIFGLAISLLIHVLDFEFSAKIGMSVLIYSILTGVIFYLKKETAWYAVYLALYNIGIFFSLIFFSNDLNLDVKVIIGFACGFIIFLFIQGMLFKLRSLKIASYVGGLGLIGLVIFFMIQ